MQLPSSKRNGTYQIRDEIFRSTTKFLSVIGHRSVISRGLQTMKSYIGCRFEHGEHLFVQKIHIHVKSTPKMIYCKASTCYSLVISVVNYVVLVFVKTHTASSH